jgi:hypothetical protein
VGKDKANTKAKQIYLLSSLNHHISIVRLRIHENFLAFIDPANFTSSSSSSSNNKSLPQTSTSTSTSIQQSTAPDTNKTTYQPLQDMVNLKPDPSWFVLPVCRTKWFDMFDPVDRVQAMRGIWAVLGWIMRDVDADTGADTNVVSTKSEN